jgi:hypothetical protein
VRRLEKIITRSFPALDAYDSIVAVWVHGEQMPRQSLTAR